MSKSQIRKILKMHYGSADPLAVQDILCLMGENGNGVSDSPSSNGALPHVGKSECLRSDSTTDSSESEHGTLENRIDSEKSSPIFIDGAFNMSYGEKLYGHSPEAIEWRKNRKKRLKES